MTSTVLTAEFFHESNTFSKTLTGLADFGEDMMLFGEAAIAKRAAANTELAGFLEVARPAGWNVIHAVSAHARPSGRVTAEAFTHLSGLILEAARVNKSRINGVLLGLHGSMGTELSPDGEGSLLLALREILGPEIPIAITLDLHAMLTDAMVEGANIIVSYKTYPHVDMRATGRHAAELLHRSLTGEIAPQSLYLRPPMLFESNGGRSDMPQTEALYEAARQAQRGPVLAVSVNAGFSGADAPCSGPSVVVSYDRATAGAEAEARAVMRKLAQQMWDERAFQRDPVLEVAAAVEIAAGWQNDRPLVMAETSDNPGSGAYGDSTNLLAALIAAGATSCVFAPIIDPEAAEELHRHREGDVVTIELGGKVDPAFGGAPLTLTGRIERLSLEGIYTGSGPMQGGLTYRFGKSAVLKVGGIEILIITIGKQMLDLEQLRVFGIEPTARRILAIKSKQHFRAAFEPIAGRVIVVDAGGLATPDLSKRPYVTVPRPIWPLDGDFDWRAPA